MHIITTIYCTELGLSQQDPAQETDQVFAMLSNVSNLTDAPRQWISLYEGKNRVLPMDGNR